LEKIYLVKIKYPMSKNPILLGVNVDHCATLRQARYKDDPESILAEPSVLQFALLSESAGADGITMHLREDRRHVQSFDIESVKASMKTRLNLEMACTEEMTEYALKLQPDSVCLVPEKREEVTTEGGLDIIKNYQRVADVIKAMKSVGVATSLFIDPDTDQIKAAAELGAPWIELHTGAFSNQYAVGDWQDEWHVLTSGAELANSLGLVVNAGHGINYDNIKQVKQLPHLNELNIGHSIVSQSLFLGVEVAVKNMLTLMHQ
jgi:pyridoxine 5-phosphate synthase